MECTYVKPLKTNDVCPVGWANAVLDMLLSKRSAVKSAECVYPVK